MAAPVVYAADENKIIRPLLVDASGRVIVTGLGDSNLLALDDQIIENWVDASIPAGLTDHSFTPVPAGEAWHISSVYFLYTGTITNVYHSWGVNSGGHLYRFIHVKQAVSGVAQSYIVDIWMIAGDVCFAEVVGATLNNDVEATYFGYTMHVQ